jgi:uncharacterized BrkB/YihY/UPF0761 family membrane protein
MKVGLWPDAMTNEVLRSEHDEVLKSVSARESTRQFAHGAVSTLLAMMTGFTALGMWLSKGVEVEWWAAFAGASVVAALYTVFRFVNGVRLNRIERTQLYRLLELRKSLGFELK